MANKLHFREIDWVIYFPPIGNEGRPVPKFSVSYLDRANATTQPGPPISLSEVLATPAIRDRFPHTVGLFDVATGKGRSWRPYYLENRTLYSEAELLAWIASLEGAAVH